MHGVSAGEAGGETYDVGVVIHPSLNSIDIGPVTGPGFDDASGRRGDRGHAVLRRGQVAVQAAVDAIAGGVGVAAQQMVDAIEARVPATARPGAFELETVEVSFGITLTGGVQALFTVQAESSAQVTLTLTRRPAPAVETPDSGRAG